MSYIDETPARMTAARDSIRAKSRQVPLHDIDNAGLSISEHQAYMDRQAARNAEFVPEIPEPVGMKPNPAQGHGGSPAVPPQAGNTGTALGRIRQQITDKYDAVLNDPNVSR